MSKRKCTIENCCNTDCRQSQKEILECKRRNKIFYQICPSCNNPYGSSRFFVEKGKYKGKYICSNCMEKETLYEPRIRELENNQTQKAIECLKEIKQDVLVDNCEDYSVDLNYLVELIDNKIKELEGNKYAN